MAHHWCRAVRAFSEAGVAVDILGEGPLIDSASEVCSSLGHAALSSLSHGTRRQVLCGMIAQPVSSLPHGSVYYCHVEGMTSPLAVGLG